MGRMDKCASPQCDSPSMEPLQGSFKVLEVSRKGSPFPLFVINGNGGLSLTG